MNGAQLAPLLVDRKTTPPIEAKILLPLKVIALTDLPYRQFVCTH
jgi:hypothetical protein